MHLNLARQPREGCQLCKPEDLPRTQSWRLSPAGRRAGRRPIIQQLAGGVIAKERHGHGDESIAQLRAPSRLLPIGCHGTEVAPHDHTGCTHQGHGHDGHDARHKGRPGYALFDARNNHVVGHPADHHGAADGENREDRSAEHRKRKRTWVVAHVAKQHAHSRNEDRWFVGRALAPVRVHTPPRAAPAKRTGVGLSRSYEIRLLRSLLWQADQHTRPATRNGSNE